MFDQDIRQKLYKEAEYLLLKKFALELTENESSDFYGMEVPETVDRETLEPIVERFEEISNGMVEDLRGIEVADLWESSENAIFIGLLEAVGSEDLEGVRKDTPIKYEQDEKLQAAFKEAIYELDWDWGSPEPSDELREAFEEARKMLEDASGAAEAIAAMKTFIGRNENKAKMVAYALLTAINEYFEDQDAPDTIKRMWIDNFLRVFASHT